MSVCEIVSTIPRGAVDFLRRLRAAGAPLDGSATPDKARAWTKRQGFATCRRAPRGVWPSSNTGWQYEISSAGRRYLDQLDRGALP